MSLSNSHAGFFCFVLFCFLTQTLPEFLCSFEDVTSSPVENCTHLIPTSSLLFGSACLFDYVMS
ncbi:hypothetical protein I79_017176 [Cricetulus griseus]|uniref:Uncharacterized protein n=1 Tax=Cricetulus griseus TaxID=10029 RepID=G3I1C3_CRIGR|nr:hypothetical protein I79_017176 [Cricetulus griseus]